MQKAVSPYPAAVVVIAVRGRRSASRDHPRRAGSRDGTVLLEGLWFQRLQEGSKGGASG